MMHNNEPWRQFKEELEARGVTMKWMWEARRDGKAPLWGLGKRGAKHRPADIGMVAFIGSDFQPSVLCAVVIDYGESNGFGLFTDSSNDIRADVEAICKPRT